MNFKETVDTSFKLLFTVLFPGIISWKGASRFHQGGGGVQMGAASFLSGGAPHGGHQF